MNSNESYFEKMRRFLDDLNNRISELELKIDNASKDIREKYKPELDDLKSLKRKFEQRLDDMKDPAKEAFIDLREGMEKAAVELNSALKKAFSRFT